MHMACHYPAKQQIDNPLSKQIEKYQLHMICIIIMGRQDHFHQTMMDLQKMLDSSTIFVKNRLKTRKINQFTFALKAWSSQAVSQCVIPAKSRETGREPGSRSLRDDSISLDAGSRYSPHRSSGMTFSANYDTACVGQDSLQGLGVVTGFLEKMKSQAVLSF